MAKLKSNLKNMVIVLTGIALVSSFLLSTVYLLTSNPIESSKLFKQQKAIKKVLPKYDVCRQSEQVNGLNVYKAYKDNLFVGAAVESFSPNGFGGEIRVMVGFDKTGNIYNYIVLDHDETKGLGSNIENWFKKKRKNQNIIGKNPKKDNLDLKKDGGEIDGITSATISSRAFLESIKKAYAAYANNSEAPDAESGATTKKPKKEIKQETIKVDTTKLEADTVKLVPIKKKTYKIKKPVIVPEATTGATIKHDTVIEQNTLKKEPKIIEKDSVINTEGKINTDTVKNNDELVEIKDINHSAVDSMVRIEKGREYE